MNDLRSFQAALSPRKRLLLLALVAVVVLGVLSATVFRDQTVSVFRRLTVSQADDFSHNAQSNSLFLGMEDDLLVCTQSQIQLFSPTGTVHFKETVSLKSPALSVAGQYAVVYDVGGQELRRISGQKLSDKLSLPTESSFLCANVNDKGWLAVTTREGGYKGVVTVYDADFQPVLSIRLSSRYISDAVVTPDCHGVYLVSPGQSGGVFENALLYYTFSSKDAPTREVSLGSNVVLSVYSGGGKCWILGDKDLFLLDSSGVITASYDYQGEYLRMGTLQGDGFATLLLARSSSGSVATLVTVGADGKEIGSLPIEGQTMALAAQGDHVGVLTTSSILTAGRRLDHYYVQPNQRGIRNLALYRDGGVALIGSATVGLTYCGIGERTVPQTQEEAAAS